MILRFLAFETVVRAGRCIIKVIGRMLLTLVVLPLVLFAGAEILHHFGYLPDPIALIKQGWRWVLSAPWTALAGGGLLALLAYIGLSTGKGNDQA